MTALVKLKRIKALVNNLAKDHQSIMPADIDEIILLAESIPESVPKKFLEVLRDADKSFNFTSMGRASLSQRLDRIIDVSEEYEISGSKLEIPSELAPTFSLAQKDKARVLELCNGMRKIIFASNVFDEPHKRRLLNRIAAIEYQVNQKKGLFDIVRGGISDLGETLGKFGVDIKPLTDRMSEVVKIARDATEEYDQLPPPEEIKKLPKPSTDDGAE